MKLTLKYVFAVGIYAFTGTGLVLGDEIPKENLSDGSPIQIEELTINPIKGWRVDRARAGMSLVIEEPKSTEVIYDKPTYSRNLSVTKYAQPTVIDSEKLASFKAELNKKFSNDARFSQFSINDAKLVDVRSKLDGVLVFTSFQINNVPMMQMHLLVSGEKHQYHLSYTDLAERMSAQDALYNQAWQSFMGVKVSTPSPEKANSGLLAALIGGFIFIIATLWLIMKSRSKKDFQDTTETLFDDYEGQSEVALEVSVYGTAINGWNIKS